MSRSKLIPATMAAIIALATAGAALAATGEQENTAEMSAILGAKTSLAEAIATAEKQTGGRAMRVDLEHKKGAYLYFVKTVSKDKVTEVFIDPASGKVTRTEDEGLIAKVFDTEDRSEFKNLAGSSVTLGSAVATAEHDTGGKAVDARFENEEGKMRYEVEVAKNNAIQKVVIDSASGKVLKVVTAEEGEHSED